jgi:flavin reductase (DIM6/NTAB) family NADH-FMN oxidoreductase RutF
VGVENTVLDTLAFRQVMSRFPTGVTVVTTFGPDGAPLGLTVNSFTSVSLDPPLVLVCLGHASSSRDPLLGARSFAVNVLSAGQRRLAARFAAEPSAGRFDGVAWRPGPNGAPVLSDVAAWVACTPEASYEAGDHTILVGRVEAADTGTEEALAFYCGAFGAVVG